ncbi:DUF1015 family protein [Saccharopolyspora rhizosphaerae]|uniref:DUF1015 family protein n=1 Tax=Saccharopolyspora rhizosphaerae TaxID=2492662 RepID=A0A3R8Q7M6_9PSEU|nr:DUF1015 family protein [Saccharopolyspora rhizosphaerae]RRO18706.1 DUF1015 family protein [Saccharopolyspora rhizosphaerae]
MSAPRTEAPTARITARLPRGLVLDHRPGHRPADAARVREAYDSGRFPRGPGPAAVVYRIAEGGHAQTGVLAEVAVDDYRTGRIRPHEATQPERERRLTEFTELSGVEQMPVMLAHSPSPGLRSAIRRITAAEPDLDFGTEDGARHTAWIRQDGELARAVEQGIGGIEGAHIADGHHRMAAAEHYAARRRHLGPDHPAAFTLAALFPADELRVFGYHRCVPVEGASAARLLDELTSLPVTAWWEQCATATPEPGVVVVRYGDETYRMGLRSSGAPGHVRGSLDVVTLDEEVLPALGASPTSCGSGAPEHCRYPAGAAVLLLAHPPTIEQIMAVSDAGLVMPPKSTWFAPKPEPGLFLRDLTGSPLGR